MLLFVRKSAIEFEGINDTLEIHRRRKIIKAILLIWTVLIFTKQKLLGDSVKLGIFHNLGTASIILL